MGMGPERVPIDLHLLMYVHMSIVHCTVVHCTVVHCTVVNRAGEMIPELEGTRP